AYSPQSTQPQIFLYAMGVQADGNIIIGGGFSRVGGGFDLRIGNELAAQFEGGYTTSILNDPQQGVPARDAVAPRANIARVLGGSTPGPGNVSLGLSNYSA